MLVLRFQGSIKSTAFALSKDSKLPMAKNMNTHFQATICDKAEKSGWVISENIPNTLSGILTR